MGFYSFENGTTSDFGSFDGVATGFQVFNTAVSANQAVVFSKPENAPKQKEVELLPVRSWRSRRQR